MIEVYYSSRKVLGKENISIDLFKDHIKISDTKKDKIFCDIILIFICDEEEYNKKLNEGEDPKLFQTLLDENNIVHYHSLA